MQVLDIAPSDATKAFSRALEEKIKRVELKVTEKDQWNREDPVIFICNNSSRIKSDLSPVMNFIGDNTSEILLVIFHCKTLKRLPVISLKEELKNVLPANIEIIEMGFDIHTTSNGIYMCDLNTTSCSRIEDYALENKVYPKDNSELVLLKQYWTVKQYWMFFRKLFNWTKQKNETDICVDSIDFERSKADTATSYFDTIQSNKADNDDSICKHSSDVTAKSKDVCATTREDASIKRQHVDVPANDVTIEKQPVETGSYTDDWHFLNFTV